VSPLSIPDQSRYNLLLYRENSGKDPDSLLSLCVNGAAKFSARMNTPLHIAVLRGNLQAVELLVSSGADLLALNERFHTPLCCTAELKGDVSSRIAELLIKNGAAVDSPGYSTPLVLAVQLGESELAQTLITASTSLKMSAYWGLNPLHAASFQWGSGDPNPALFSDLLRRGFDPYYRAAATNPSMPAVSAIHVAMCHRHFTALLLNSDLRVGDSGPFPSTQLFHPGYAWLADSFRLYRRKVEPGQLRTLMNMEHRDGWTLLCRAASIGLLAEMRTLISMGANLDYEGCPLGSALIAACEAGRLESVRLLVRSGAAISYPTSQGTRSAVTAANGSKAILNWLFVLRFTEQGKLENPAESGGTPLPWSGVVKAELILSGRRERRSDESSLDYWCRLLRIRKELRGTVIVPGRGRTSRPSRLQPEERVHVSLNDTRIPSIS
jgi:ankyrin repeat protein